MLDHITLHVRDVERSIAFYRQALAPLGYIVKAHHEPTLGFGVDDGTPHSDFYISPIDTDDPADTRATPVTHIAFLAPDHESVHAFHEAALAAGGTDNGAPGPRPYHPGYYSAFVLDPDGNNIEAVTDWAGWFTHRADNPADRQSLTQA
ncbi:VOC family protein [Bifidobacterium callimiconis]|uniref:Glyoxalase n=1 Tax=Bifidobacterium callimiconis TaxID=2306973 RepID=A0A430FHS7_9BIFI|nr:VOC family protein [Bifidobacterium callimiconis]MBT1176490.1 VOC family protein [Bifidobacterium callimiconis]RSX52377.1 glyoxalase [Bifidobacterium callimiconis]